jgi:hypothetical protein
MKAVLTVKRISSECVGVASLPGVCRLILITAAQYTMIGCGEHPHKCVDESGIRGSCRAPCLSVIHVQLQHLNGFAVFRVCQKTGSAVATPSSVLV